MDNDIQVDIERALYRHAWGYDEADWDRFAKGWAEDGELLLILGDGVEAPAGIPEGSVPDEGLHTVGRDAIIERFKKGRAAFAEQGEQPRHVILNVLVDDVNGDTAKVRCFHLFMVTSAKGVGIHGSSVYHDEMVRGGDGWLIKSRRNVVSSFGTGLRL